MTQTLAHIWRLIAWIIEEIPPLFEHSYQFFAQRKGPFARQVHERERYESLGPRWSHDPQFDDHSEHSVTWLSLGADRIISVLGTHGWSERGAFVERSLRLQ